MRPAREVFPDIDRFPKPGRRGPQKAPTKVQIDDPARPRRGRAFPPYRPRLAGRMNETLRRAVKRQRQAR